MPGVDSDPSMPSVARANGAAPTSSVREERQADGLSGGGQRWHRLADLVPSVFVDAMVVAALIIILALGGLGTTLASRPSMATIVLALLVILPLVWRRRYPLQTMASQLAVSGFMRLAPLFGSLLGPDDGVLTLSAGVAHLPVEVGLYGLAARRGAGAAVVVGSLDVALTAASVLAGAKPIDVLVSLAVRDALFVLFGLYLPVRRAYLNALRQRTDQIEQRRLLETAAAVREERSRIARELHDVVAHHVSVMVLHAGALEERLSTAEAGRDVMDGAAAIRRSGREAMSELRHVLDVLRDPGGVDDDRHPQPSLQQIHQVVDRMRGTGLRIELTVEGPIADVGPGASLAAIRIVQESLTNVVRHSGLVATWVILQITDHSVRVQVRNAGLGLNRVGGTLHRSTGVGAGIVGMRERVSARGGSLSVGPAAGAGWVVDATLPHEKPGRDLARSD